MIGSGPGIGTHVASEFATKRFNNVALLARDAHRLAEAQAAIEAVVDGTVTVRTFRVDITDSHALHLTLEEIGQMFGQPECVYFNAATIVPTKFFEIGEHDIKYDFDVSCLSIGLCEPIWTIDLTLILDHMYCPISYGQMGDAAARCPGHVRPASTALFPRNELSAAGATYRGSLLSFHGKSSAEKHFAILVECLRSPGNSYRARNGRRAGTSSSRIVESAEYRRKCMGPVRGRSKSL